MIPNLPSVVNTLFSHEIPILDVRSRDSYQAARLPQSCHIPLDQVASSRAFELPPRHVPFAVLYDKDLAEDSLRFFSSRDTPWSIAAFLCVDDNELSFYHEDLVSRITGDTDSACIQSSGFQDTAFRPGVGKRFRREAAAGHIENSDDKTLDTDSSVHDETSNSQRSIESCVLHMRMHRVAPSASTLATSTESKPNSSFHYDSALSPLWAACCQAGVPVQGASDPDESVLLFEPCPLLRRFLPMMELSLMRSHLTPASLASISAPSAVEPHPAAPPAPLQLACLDIGCGHARDSLFMAKRRVPLPDADTAAALDQLSQDVQSSASTAPVAAHPVTPSSTSSSRPHRVARGSPPAQWRVVAVDEVAGILQSVVKTVALHGLQDRIAVVRTKIVEEVARVPKAKQRAPRQSKAEGECDDGEARQSGAAASASASVDADADAEEALRQRAQQAIASMLRNRVLFTHKPLARSQDTTVSPAPAPTTAWEQAKYDLVLCVRFLVPALLPRLEPMVRPGGFLVYSHFYQGCSHPANVLYAGQLRAALGPRWEVWCDEVEVLGDGRPVNNFIARKIAEKDSDTA